MSEESKDELSQPSTVPESIPQLRREFYQLTRRIEAYGGPLPRPLDLKNYDKVVQVLLSASLVWLKGKPRIVRTWKEQ